MRVPAAAALSPSLLVLTKAFTVVPSRNYQTVMSNSVRHATIYFPRWDEEDSLFRSDDDDDEYSNQRFGSPSLMERLSKDSLAALARLAVAFSPPGQSLHLRDIEHIDVLSVDENHIDIEAVVCERGGCVTLAVPISFPHPCELTDDEGELAECILDNLGELDHSAVEIIRKIEWEEEHHEELAEEARRLQALRDTEHVQYPSWWIYQPGDRELEAEAKAIRSLLNEEDFQTEIQAIATQALLASGEEDFEVEQAAVIAVGPAGLVIRVHASEVTILEESIKMATIEVPVPFRKPIESVAELRDAVLGVVAAATNFLSA